MKPLFVFAAGALALAACKTDAPPPEKGGEAPKAEAKADPKAAAKADPKADAKADAKASAKRPASHAAPKATPLAEHEPAAFRTTSSKIFWLNLRGELKELGRLVEKNPKNVVMWRKLGSVHHRLGFLTGRIDHLAESLKALDTAVELDGGSFDTRIVRARTRQSLHDFEGALQDVTFVLDKRADHKGAIELRDAIHWSVGNYADGKARLQTAAFAAKTTAQAGAARQLFLTGKIEQARKGYAAAMSGFRGVNPSTVAWLEVQRGVTYLDAGLYPEAETLFAAAARRLDEFTMAEEHLAEVKSLLGKHAEAERLYRRVVERSGDPVFRVALAETLEAAGKAEEAEKELATARAEFRARLKAFPQASWQDAAEFELDHGDPAKALELAGRNAKLRQDAASLALLARVQAKAGKKEQALASIAKALASPLRTAALFEAASEVYAGAGKADDAAKWLAEAKSLNPKAG